MSREALPGDSAPGIRAATLALGAAWLAVAIGLPERLLIGLVPDDAFYYLGIAAHRARHGLWSFDGLHPTTGFHLFHAFWLAGLIRGLDLLGLGAWVAGTAPVRLVAGLGVVVATVGALAVHRVLRPALGARADLALLVMATSSYAALAALNALESAETLVVAGLMLASFSRVVGAAAAWREGGGPGAERTMTDARAAALVDRPRHDAFAGRGHEAGLVAAAVLAPLVRTDLVFLVIGIVLAGFGMASGVPPAARPRLRRALAMTGLASAFSFALVTVFCLAVTGRPTQDSGEVKRLWHALSEPSPAAMWRDLGPMLRLVLNTPFGARRIVSEKAALALEAGFVACAALAAVARRGGRARAIDREDAAVTHPPPGRDPAAFVASDATLARRERTVLAAILAAVAIQLLGLLAYYGFAASEAQPHWYFASLQWGFAIALAALLQAAWRGAPVVGVALIAVLAVTGLASGAVTVARGYWPRQRDFLSSARWLAVHPPPGAMAAWNAGILSWYSGRPVINLDGVVNGDIHAAMRRREATRWIDAHRVRWILDATEMPATPHVAASLDTAAFRAAWRGERRPGLPASMSLWVRRGR